MLSEVKVTPWEQVPGMDCHVAVKRATERDLKNCEEWKDVSRGMIIGPENIPHEFVYHPQLS
jgi:hypothetical protein